MFYVVSNASDLSLTSMMLLCDIILALHVRNLFRRISISWSPSPHHFLMYPSQPSNSFSIMSRLASMFSRFELTMFLTPASSPSSAGFLRSRSTNSPRSGARPMSVRAYSSDITSSETPARESSSAANRPVRSLPAVQWKTHADGSAPDCDRCLSISPNAGPAFERMSRYACTKPEVPERVYAL
jgi:hypothetical protein